MKARYSFSGMKENMAKALGRDLGISPKTSQEIADNIRGKTTEQAKRLLNDVMAMKRAMPYKRYVNGVGHRRGAGLGAGRYPQKASAEFLKLIESAEANAQAKGLSSELKIISIVPQEGSNMYRSGRLRRRMYKRTHLEIVLEEMEKKQTKQKQKKKEEPKVETEKKTPEAAPKKQETKQLETKEKKAVPKEASKKKTQSTKEEKPEAKE